LPKAPKRKHAFNKSATAFPKGADRVPKGGVRLPILDDPRYECFSQLVSRGVPQGKAYVEAGFQATTDQSIRVGAHKLAKKPAIAKRVTELQEAAARRAQRESGIDKKWVLLRLRDLSDAAQGANQYGPSVRAVELVGKELGLFVDRHEVKSGPLDALSTLGMEDLDAVIEACNARLADPANAGESGDTDSSQGAFLPPPFEAEK
jgi:hypothetical protein